MKGKYEYGTHAIVEVVSLFICLAGLAGGDSWADGDTKYLDAVRMFADNVSRFFHCEYHGQLEEHQQKRDDKRTYDHLVFYGGS